MINFYSLTCKYLFYACHIYVIDSVKLGHIKVIQYLPVLIHGNNLQTVLLVIFFFAVAIIINDCVFSAVT